MSKWESFPYLAGGRELGRKPLWVQYLLFAPLGVSWIVVGLLVDQRWPLVLGALLLVAPLIGLARRRRSRDGP
jgi:hypothetical protein